MEEIKNAIGIRKLRQEQLLLEASSARNIIKDKRISRRKLKDEINTLRREEAAIMQQVDEIQKIINALEITKKVVDDDINGI